LNGGGRGHLFGEQENQTHERDHETDDQRTVNGAKTDLAGFRTRREGYFIHSTLFMSDVTEFSHALP
jgi:hypothetical protein